MRHTFRIELPQDVVIPKVHDIVRATLVLLRDGRPIAHEAFSTDGEKLRANLERWLVDMVPPEEHGQLASQIYTKFIDFFEKTEASGLVMERSGSVLTLRPVAGIPQSTGSATH